MREEKDEGVITPDAGTLEGDGEIVPSPPPGVSGFPEVDEEWLQGVLDRQRESLGEHRCGCGGFFRPVRTCDGWERQCSRCGIYEERNL